MQAVMTACCDMECCFYFKVEESLQLSQRYYFKSFDERREYVINVGGQLHT
jgi:hypothetical protein